MNKLFECYIKNQKRWSIDEIDTRIKAINTIIKEFRIAFQANNSAMEYTTLNKSCNNKFDKQVLKFDRRFKRLKEKKLRIDSHRFIDIICCKNCTANILADIGSTILEEQITNLRAK